MNQRDQDTLERLRESLEEEEIDILKSFLSLPVMSSLSTGTLKSVAQQHLKNKRDIENGNKIIEEIDGHIINDFYLCIDKIIGREGNNNVDESKLLLFELINRKLTAMYGSSGTLTLARVN